MKPHSFGHPVPRTVVVGLRTEMDGGQPTGDSVLLGVWYLMSTALTQLEIDLEGDWELSDGDVDHVVLSQGVERIDLIRQVVK